MKPSRFLNNKSPQKRELFWEPFATLKVSQPLPGSMPSMLPPQTGAAMHWQSSASSAWRGPFTALTSCAGCVAQVMAFGRAKKVGMKRALKFKAVAEPEAVPEARGTKSITPTAWAELPPWVAAQEPSLPTRVPPSPAKLQVNAAAAWCRHMDLKAHGCALAVRDGEKALAVAKKIDDAKMTAIFKLEARKVNPIMPIQVLNRLWKASDAYQVVLLRLYVLQWHAALAVVAARDAQISLLQQKLKRVSSQRRRSRPNRYRMFGSPGARFKFSARK